MEKLFKAVWDGNANTWSELELTPEEYVQREEALKQAEIERVAREEAEAKKAADREAGLAVLKANGLTDEQISALFN